MLASWVPEKERSKLGSVVFGGGQVSNFIYKLIKNVTTQASSNINFQKYSNVTRHVLYVFSDWLLVIFLFIWFDIEQLSMGNGLLFLEYCSDCMVYSFCKSCQKTCIF